jgi:hypothetical protein
MCQTERNEKLNKIRNLVRNNPGISPMQVSLETEVPAEVILQLIESGTIEILPPPGGKLL